MDANTYLDKEDFAAVKGGIDALPSSVFPNSACSKLKYGESLLASLTVTQCTRTALSSQSKALANWWQTGGDNLRRCVSAILKAPYVMKKLDVFMPGRLDSNYMIEHYAEVLIEMVKE
ncbi:hypothetical protein BC827DRAFT_1251902 [Russula dissimulans]|nr:hypothetical protein BC827DRAFT_1251902 [Russula dissimulans]